MTWLLKLRCSCEPNSLWNYCLSDLLSLWYRFALTVNWDYQNVNCFPLLPKPKVLTLNLPFLKNIWTCCGWHLNDSDSKTLGNFKINKNVPPKINLPSFSDSWPAFKRCNRFNTITALSEQSDYPCSFSSHIATSCFYLTLVSFSGELAHCLDLDITLSFFKCKFSQ